MVAAHRDAPEPRTEPSIQTPAADDLRRFHNRLRVLTSIDMHELVAAGVIAHADWNAWGTFRRDPFRWFIRADDAKARAVFAIIRKREGR
jgi:sulfur transfer complex TusBCD TusB component (DsrH family)